MTGRLRARRPMTACLRERLKRRTISPGPPRSPAATTSGTTGEIPRGAGVLAMTTQGRLVGVPRILDCDLG